MEKKEKLVLAVDFGTQSLRVSIVNQFGEIKAIIKNKYNEAYFSSEPGFAEQNQTTIGMNYVTPHINLKKSMMTFYRKY